MGTRQELAKAEAPPIEWLGWDETMRLVQAAKAGSFAWRVLADWCAQGLIESKAAKAIREGEVVRDIELNAELWGLVARLGLLDPLNGSIEMAAAETGSSLSIFGLQFRKDQVLEMVSHVDPDEVAAALNAKGPWLGGKNEPAPVVEAVKVESPRGRKPEKERWQAFYFAVVELAQDGRLSVDGFRSASELSEELLAMMGDSAFSADHVKGVVGQIYKRFCAG